MIHLLGVPSPGGAGASCGHRPSAEGPLQPLQPSGLSLALVSSPGADSMGRNMSARIPTPSSLRTGPSGEDVALLGPGGWAGASSAAEFSLKVPEPPGHWAGRWEVAFPESLILSQASSLRVPVPGP